MHLRLQSFDGPLDLLLHLIKAQELNIFNIPMTLIAEQFLGFLRQVPELDFHQAGEYLAMAAQLIEIKAAMLVPALQNKFQNDAQSLLDVPEDDPRRPLIEALMEREAIRQACLELDKLSLLGRDVFPSGESVRRASEYENIEAPLHGDVYSLAIAFERVLLRFAETRSAPVVRVRAQKITIQSKMEVVRRKFEFQNEFGLRELFLDCDSRYELIVTFMAVLELSKSNYVSLLQDQLFGPVIIAKGIKYSEAAPAYVEAAP